MDASKRETGQTGLSIYSADRGDATGGVAPHDSDSGRSPATGQRDANGRFVPRAERTAAAEPGQPQPIKRGPGRPPKPKPEQQPIGPAPQPGTTGDTSGGRDFAGGTAAPRGKSTSETGYTEAQVKALAEGIAQQIGFVTDALTIARGKHWYVTDQRLRKLGMAYANIIQYYVPVDMMGKGSAGFTAFMATASVFGPPLAVEMNMASQKRAQENQQAVRGAEEILRRTRPQQPPAPPQAPPASMWGWGPEAFGGGDPSEGQP